MVCNFTECSLINFKSSPASESIIIPSHAQIWAAACPACDRKSNHRQSITILHPTCSVYTKTSNILTLTHHPHHMQQLTMQHFYLDHQTTVVIKFLQTVFYFSIFFKLFPQSFNTCIQCLLFCWHFVGKSSTLIGHHRVKWSICL